MFLKDGTDFALKSWYKGGHSLLTQEWNNLFDTTSPTRKAVFNLLKHFKENESVLNCHRSSTPSLYEETKLMFYKLLFICRLAFEQNVSGMLVS